MMWELPVVVEIEGIEHKIRNSCDYKVVLDTLSALNDIDLPENKRIECALFIFYEDSSSIHDVEKALYEMLKIINYGEDFDERSQNKPKIMDWQHDFKNIAPPISRVLGYDIRISNKYTHWWTFLGGYMEIGESVFANVVNIRNKRRKGQKLEKWEEEFYNENRKMIDLPMVLSEDDDNWLNCEL